MSTVVETFLDFPNLKTVERVETKLSGHSAVEHELHPRNSKPRTQEPMRGANTYGRMFPELERPGSTSGSGFEEGLATLADKMRDDGKVQRGNVLAGYTYFGQFIDHDLTLDLTPLDYAQTNAGLTLNFRTPFLDLDHLYAGGPNLSPFLYEMKFPPGKERFLVGMTRNARKHEDRISPNDLPRNAEGTALVGDARQDENLIIAQLHVAFLKFHNAVLEGLDSRQIISLGPSGATIFEQARRIVTWVYQYLVLNDFLKALANPETTRFDELKAGLARARTWRARQFRIPIEFSVAAFRFGHSMVRQEYDYNLAQGIVELAELLDRTGNGTPGKVPLAADWVIKWDHFFDLGIEPPRQDARAINTQIVDSLHGLDQSTIKLYKTARLDDPPEVPPPKHSLPVRTLWRGARVGLPTAQQIAKALKASVFAPDQIAAGPHNDVLRAYKLHEETPLWYYVLKEAELESNGNFLGEVGTRLVGNVLVNALAADPDSYVSLLPSWRPVLGKRTINYISDVLLLSREPSVVWV